MKKILFLGGAFIVVVLLVQIYAKSDSKSKLEKRIQGGVEQLAQIDNKPVATERTFVYQSYIDKTKETLDKFTMHITELPLGRKRIKWNVEKENSNRIDEFTLDADYATIDWKVESKDEDINYIGKREGDTIILEGKQKGEKIKKRIQLDDRPFYFNPQVSLTKFVTSNIHKIKFWSLRKDILEKYLMKAEKIDVQTIDVNGRNIEVVKVYFSATGIGERFFNRTYFFRKSDGLFVSQGVSNGWKSDLIKEVN